MFLAYRGILSKRVGAKVPRKIREVFVDNDTDHRRDHLVLKNHLNPIA
jgi:hypothetical protein